MFIKEYDRRFPSPGHVVASQVHWRRLAHSDFPCKPADYLAMLDPGNPLRFRQLKYRKGKAATAVLQATLQKAQFLQREFGKQSGLGDYDRILTAKTLMVLDGADDASFCNYYIGGIVSQCRTSRNELVVVVGSTAQADFYRTIRISEVSSTLHLRFQCRPFGHRKVEAVDYRLSSNPETQRMDILVREHWKVHDNPDVYPWAFINGSVVDNPSKNSCCRDIELSRSRKPATSKDWFTPVREYDDVAFESLAIL